MIDRVEERERMQRALRDAPELLILRGRRRVGKSFLIVHALAAGCDAVIPCGGTHVRSLDEFVSITVSLEMPDPQTLVMSTSAVSAGAADSIDSTDAL